MRQRNHPWLAGLDKGLFPGDKTGGRYPFAVHTKLPTCGSVHNGYMSTDQRETSVKYGVKLGASSHRMMLLPVCRVKLSNPSNSDVMENTQSRVWLQEGPC